MSTYHYPVASSLPPSIIMGQDISTSILPPPLLFQHCIVDGEINIPRFTYYRRKQDRQWNYFNDYKTRSKRKVNDTFNHIASFRKAKRVRTVKRHKLSVRDKEGNLREILPTDTLWYVIYINNPPHNK